MIEDQRSITVPVRRPLVDQVIRSLRDLIELEGLGTGDKLPSESRLAERLGVGRSTLREAVRVLAHSGELEARQGSGTYVGRSNDPASQDAGLDQRLAAARVPEVFEVRRALELLIAQCAPSRRSDEHLARMREALQDCRRLADTGAIADFVEADARFHQISAEASGNSVLVEMYAALRRPLENALVVVADIVELHRANDRHQVLMDAIAEGDPEAAVAATKAHLDETVAMFTSRSTRP